ncbi:MAG TPA: ATP synthase F1 subunit delta [Ardenticatenaceae bacterium]|nr:ATP synthase F1 subunit delta [Ardenticatenaceae bacterium]
MSATGVNTNYARAILREALAPWLEELRAAARTVRTSGGGTGAADQARVVHGLPATTRPEVRRLVQLLAREGDLERLPDILRELEMLTTGQEAARAARVTTAVEMTPVERQNMEAKLRQRFGQELLFEYEVDPALLGGVRVQVADTVIDGSVASRLEAMRERLVGS